MRICTGGLCLLTLVAVQVLAEFPCKSIIQCRCGASNTTHKFCHDERSAVQSYCKRFSGCSKCKDHLRKCLECPNGYSGNFCFNNLKRQKRQTAEHSRRGRNYSSSRNAGKSRRSVLMYCNDPGFDDNGERKPKDTPSKKGFIQGSAIEYSCNEGYALIGSKRIFCLLTGKWSSDTPFCERPENLAGCGRPRVRTNVKVHFGIKPQKGEWPWVVALKIHQDGTELMACGGALIDESTVLTAAHCIVAEVFTLYFGKVYVDDTREDTDVMVRISNKIIKHPNYTRSTYDSDIAIIKFSPKIVYSDRIQPICLPTEESTEVNLMTGHHGYVAGWGVNENNVQSEELMYLSIPVLTNDNCIKSFKSQSLNIPINENKYCAGFPEGRRVVCKGDSGSPMVFYDAIDNRFTIQGIVSFMASGECGLPNRYSIFTNVYRFIPWINKVR